MTKTAGFGFGSVTGTTQFRCFYCILFLLFNHLLMLLLHHFIVKCLQPNLVWSIDWVRGSLPIYFDLLTIDVKKSWRGNWLNKKGVSVMFVVVAVSYIW